MSDNTLPYEDAVCEVRKACRQFAMLYFHFAKVLVEELGIERAKPLIQKAVFELSLDRSGQLREKAAQEGLPYTMESFMKLVDLPFIGWVKELGRDHCPYAETWRKYYDEYLWFREIAPLYCDVIDTTNAENFTRCLSHKITKNVLTGADTCERVYFESESVQKGEYSYGEKTAETKT
ncbi:MAG: hypothetical protein E7476_13880 [Ruminococcaceae bacterium]|nr:hypothetical protein [Oscillospiraceae bacterium]